MATYNEFEQRYEMLKRLYFRGPASEYDEETGEELPTLITRQQILQQFENMGVELPMSPTDPIKFIKRQPKA